MAGMGRRLVFSGGSLSQLFCGSFQQNRFAAVWLAGSQRAAPVKKTWKQSAFQGK
jgi:hypothetical protein